MTDISCSNGDLSSTPSNLSEYFSVTSSLNILNSNDEVYHSLDEELPDEIQCQPFIYFKKSEHHKIVKQNNLEIDGDFHLAEEMIIETEICRNNNKCDFFENETEINERNRSRDSINSSEEEINNDSTLSNSFINKTIMSNYYKKESISDNEFSISDSGNNITQINTSHIEGELSDINDIIYDSSISPIDTQGQLISKENNSSEIEMDNDFPQSNNLVFLSPDYYNFTNIVRDQITDETELNKKYLPALEMVIQLENKESPIKTNKEQIDYRETSLKNINENYSNEVKNILTNTADIKNEHLEKMLDESNKIFETTNKKSLIEYTEDSPIKKSYLCCSIRRKRKKESPKLNFIQKFKTRHIFSFLKSSNSSKKLEAEVVSEPINNSYENPISIKSVGQDYDGIPFIDADVIIDTEAYITLAKQELFLE